MKPIKKKSPLRKIKSIVILKKGINISTNLLFACSLYSIKVFIGNNQKELCMLYGFSQHAVVLNRKNQFDFLKDEEKKLSVCKKFIYGKIKNQRATLLYFGKQNCGESKKKNIKEAANELDINTKKLKVLTLSKNWRKKVMGIEGYSARIYWQIIAKDNWLGEGFKNRIGRGAFDNANKALNYGYAILSSIIWNAIANSGLEAYYGALHTERAGKPSLVLDIMEEFRPWVVDRSVIKIRKDLDSEVFTTQIKQKIAKNILKTMDRKINHKGKNVRLESLIQRQCYRLNGTFSGKQKYSPVLFKW